MALPLIPLLIEKVQYFHQEKEEKGRRERGKKVARSQRVRGGKDQSHSFFSERGKVEEEKNTLLPAGEKEDFL